MTEKEHRIPSLVTTRRGAMKLLAIGAGGLMMPQIFAGTAMAANASPSGQVVVGLSQEPTAFNPLMPLIETDVAVHSALFDRLLKIDEKGTLLPSLAAEVPTVENGGISEDGLSWRIKLREDVKWHDGQPFTADDVKFTIELAVNPNFKSGRRSGHELVKDITVVSPTELTWTMTESYSPYLSILAGTSIIPKHAFDGVEDPNTAPFNNAPIGTGPFKWGTRIAGDYLELVANTDYHGEGPYLEKFIFKYIQDLTVLYTQFRTGDIDAVSMQYITVDNYAEAQTLPGKDVFPFASTSIETILVNLGRVELADPVVRQAIYAAIDKQTIIDALYSGVPKSTESFVPAESFYFNADLPAHEYSANKANQMLDEAGWTRGGDGVREKDGMRLSFAISCVSGNHLREQAQQFIQQTLAEVGIQVEIRNYPSSVLYGDMYRLSQFDLLQIGLPLTTGGDPDASNFFLSTFIPAKGGAGGNTSQYANPEVDRLFAEGNSVFSPDERLPIFQELQAIIRNDLPILPMFQQTFIHGYDARLTGYVPNINVLINVWNPEMWRWSDA